MTERTDFKALIVDDDDGFREVLTGYLEPLGITVRQASSGEHALLEIEKALPDVVFLDVYMPGMDGLQSLKAIRAKHQNLKVIVMSGYATEEIARKAMDLGAFDFMNKPIEMERISDILVLIMSHQLHVPSA